MYSFVK